MSFRHLLPIALALAVCCRAGRVFGSQTDPQLALTVAQTGDISAVIDIPVKANQGLAVVALPFTVDPGHTIAAPNDVHVSELSNGNGYCFLVAAIPAASLDLHIEIKHASHITETPDGKGKFEFDATYPLLTQTEKQLLSSPVCTAGYDIVVTLPPRLYDPSDINLYPVAFTRRNNNTFEVSAKDVSQVLGKSWIAFPNPIQHALDLSKVLIGALIGLLGIVAQANLSLRDRRSFVLWIVGLTSLAIILACVLFMRGLSEAKMVEFLVFAIAAVVNAAYAFLASVYALVAKRFQAVIAGQVKLNNDTTTYADVALMRVDLDPNIVVARREELKEGGHYKFHIWRPKAGQKYQVVAKHQYSNEGRSVVFKILPGKKVDILVISLTAAPVVVPSPQGGAGAAA